MTETVNATIVEEIESLPIPISITGTALEAMTRGEVDVQVSTAMRYGRDVGSCLNEAKTLATLTPEIAESCYYALPRAGKTIQGPSVRLAEIMVQSWKHMRIQAQIIGQDDSFVTARAVAWDLYKNVAVATEVRRRITDRNGKKLNEDMIGVASQAAISIASRNAIFSVVPQAIVQEVYKAALRTAAGQAQPLGIRREKALQWFGKQGIDRKRVFELLEVPGEDDMTADDVERLTGIATALKEGTGTLEDVFPTKAEPPVEKPEPALAMAEPKPEKGKK